MPPEDEEEEQAGQEEGSVRISMDGEEQEEEDSRQSHGDLEADEKAEFIEEKVEVEEKDVTVETPGPRVVVDDEEKQPIPEGKVETGILISAHVVVRFASSWDPSTHSGFSATTSSTIR